MSRNTTAAVLIAISTLLVGVLGGFVSGYNVGHSQAKALQADAEQAQQEARNAISAWQDAKSRVTQLEADNSRLRAAAEDESRTMNALRRAVKLSLARQVPEPDPSSPEPAEETSDTAAPATSPEPAEEKSDTGVRASSPEPGKKANKARQSPVANSASGKLASVSQYGQFAKFEDGRIWEVRFSYRTMVNRWPINSDLEVIAPEPYGLVYRLVNREKGETAEAELTAEARKN